MSIKQKHICWNITTRCNATCPFCHRMNHVGDLPYKLTNEILHKLIECGVRKISWTGGEALLYENLDSLVKKAKANGIINHLITNGKAFTKERIDSLAPMLDIVTLSLDSCDNETNELMGRGYEQYKEVAKIVTYIKEKYPHLKIKINTVACKINKKNLIDISEFILKHKIDRWKIFRFMDLRGDAITNKDKYWISLEEFVEIQQRVNEKLISNGYHGHAFIDIDDFEEDYILIRADGAVVVTRNKEDKILGNLLFDDMIEILIRSNV